MSRVITNPSPKQRFQESNNNITAHREMVGSTTFQRAVDFGLMEYADRLRSLNGQPSEAAIVGLKLFGAMELVQVLRNLSESTTPPTPVSTPNLDHNA